MTDDIRTGGCQCGAVRFRVEPPTLFCCHCHCAWCRRAHGAAFVTWFGAPEAAFSLTSGADGLRWYSSSAESERGFCGACGTTLFFRSKLAPGFQILHSRALGDHLMGLVLKLDEIGLPEDRGIDVIQLVEQESLPHLTVPFLVHEGIR